MSADEEQSYGEYEEGLGDPPAPFPSDPRAPWEKQGTSPVPAGFELINSKHLADMRTDLLKVKKVIDELSWADRLIETLYKEIAKEADLVFNLKHELEISYTNARTLSILNADLERELAEAQTLTVAEAERSAHENRIQYERAERAEAKCTELDNALRGGIDIVEGLLFESEADSARLDWLEQHAELIRDRNRPNMPFASPLLWDSGLSIGLREAIDAVRAAEQEAKSHE